MRMLTVTKVGPVTDTANPTAALAAPGAVTHPTINPTTKKPNPVILGCNGNHDIGDDVLDEIVLNSNVGIVNVNL